LYANPVVTQIEAAGVFYLAEDYHQNYYNQNKEQGYCQYVIAREPNNRSCSRGQAIVMAKCKILSFTTVR
jgi:peptide methionine sulfoxide reductase MsrA